MVQFRELSSLLCGDLEGWECGGWVGGRLKRNGDMYIPMADSLHCTAEINTTLLNIPV